jgi:predicted nucleic acid-binding protein
MATYLFDTNILLRLLDVTAAQHPLVSQAVLILESQEHVLKVCSQNIVEFWAVATRPIAANGFGWNLEQTRSEVDRILSIYELLPDSPAIFATWLELVTTYKVSGKQVHDARLAATTKVHDIENLLTLNVDDFKRFNVKAVHPSEIIT